MNPNMDQVETPKKIRELTREQLIVVARGLKTLEEIINES